MRPCSFLSLSALALVFAAGATLAEAAASKLLRDRAPSERPRLVVVGVAHFANPGLDSVNMKVDDVLAPKRQRDIADILERLAAFEPTRVVVEWPIAKQAELDERYAAYRAGKYQLTRNEVDQLGLRLAAKLGLERVYAADWNENPPGKEADYDFQAWADQHGEKNRLDAIFDKARARKEEARLARSTLGEFICWLNEPERLAADNRVYFDIAMLGTAEDNPGANWVGSWHARNLKIFANLVRVADKPDDRIVAIFGAGHAFLLNEYAAQSGAMASEPLGDVLRCR